MRVRYKAKMQLCSCGCGGESFSVLGKDHNELGPAIKNPDGTAWDLGNKAILWEY